MSTVSKGFLLEADRYRFDFKICYRFDFKICTPDKGWAQFDTEQDASYYGQWINPFTRVIVSYAEGDVSNVTCETDAEFTRTVFEYIGWHIDRGEKDPAIDGMCRPEIIDRFKELGLGLWLH